MFVKYKKGIEDFIEYACVVCNYPLLMTVLVYNTHHTMVSNKDLQVSKGLTDSSLSKIFSMKSP